MFCSRPRRLRLISNSQSLEQANNVLARAAITVMIDNRILSRGHYTLKPEGTEL